MDTNERDAITFTNALIHFFMAPFRLLTYTNLLYLMLAFPLGVAYFVFLVAGLAAGFGLTIVWIGIPLLALVFAGSWAFAAFERQMAIHLLGAGISPMIPLILPAPDGEARTALQRAGDFFGNPSTWKGMGFLLLKLPLGLVSFVAVVTMLATSAAFLLAPVAWMWGGLDIDVDGLAFQVDSIGGVWACALLGLGLLFLSLNLLNALALVWRGTATVLLGSDRLAAAAPPTIPDAVAA
jgi:hypothetical protein